MSEITVTVSGFENDVIKSEKPVLIDFWATWCGPCRMMAPVIKGIAEEFEGKLTVGKVNVDEEGELAAKFGIQAIPTLVLFKGGKAVSATEGFQAKSEVREWLASNGIN